MSFDFPMVKDIKQQMDKTIVSCSNCILSVGDTKYISFDDQGVCNYCKYYYDSVKVLGTIEEKTTWLNNKVKEITIANKGKKYNCILGVSGGVDSSYLAYWCKQNNLRPLVVHLDNGWDSELATKNIENICNVLGFNLHTYVINWVEFKLLQVAYFKAGVIDIEVLTDHAIHAILIKIAKKYKIKYILNGNNLSTEAIMPKDWVFDKLDWRNIKDIYSQFGSGEPIKSFPHITFLQKLYNYWFLKIEDIQVLNYLNYNKKEAKAIIKEKFGWRDYGGKHHESVFTKFYQSYILPVKFNVDKRKAHLSTLICSGQITREEALIELKKTVHTSDQEKKYVLKKLEFSNEEFDKYMKEVPRLHSDFKSEKDMWQLYFKVIRLIRFWKA